MNNCGMGGEELDVAFLLRGERGQSLRRLPVAVVHARRYAVAGRAAALRGDRLHQSRVIQETPLISNGLGTRVEILMHRPDDRGAAAAARGRPDGTTGMAWTRRQMNLLFFPLGLYPRTHASSSLHLGRPH